jgi:hypothetical protein
MKRQNQRAKIANPAANQNSLLQGLEEHYEPTRKGADKDQFGVQDRIFSKWACIMQCSTDGTTWFDCKQVNFCNNCGDKVCFNFHLMRFDIYRFYFQLRHWFALIKCL